MIRVLKARKNGVDQFEQKKINKTCCFYARSGIQLDMPIHHIFIDRRSVERANIDVIA